MIIVVGGIKGGSGKTTVATNLATLFYRKGDPLILVDADEQGSAYDWAQQRPDSKAINTVCLRGNKIHRDLSDLHAKYDDVIVDVGGRDTYSLRSALTVADIFISPFKPRSFDIWTLGPLKTMIEEIESINPKMKSYYVINQGDSKGSDNATAIELLSEFPFFIYTTIIGHRKAFADAASEGLGVIEMPRRDEKAITEINALYDRILNKYKKGTKKI